jgi:hypothetical protein
MMAPPGDKSKGFALGATLGVGGKVALTNPKVRDLIGADEMIENMKKSKNGQKVTQTSTNSKTTKGAPAASADPETKVQSSATKKFKRKGPQNPPFGPDGKAIEFVKRPKKRFVPKKRNSI